MSVEAVDIQESRSYTLSSGLEPNQKGLRSQRDREVVREEHRNIGNGRRRGAEEGSRTSAGAGGCGQVGQEPQAVQQ